jgi:hypothetical protein
MPTRHNGPRRAFKLVNAADFQPVAPCGVMLASYMTLGPVGAAGRKLKGVGQGRSSAGVSPAQRVFRVP